MPYYTDLTGLAGIAGAAAAVAFLLQRRLLPGKTLSGKSYAAMLLPAVFVLMLIPFGGMPLAAYVRGATGDLSITTLVLLAYAVPKPGPGSVAAEARNRFALLLVIALAALVLYPLALGAGAYDPYRLGYGYLFFVAVLLLLALAAWLRKFSLIALCIALAALAWATGWYESGNLWDYLLDPFVAIYAWAVAINFAMKALLKAYRGSSR